jgi:hypothetical protein
MQMGSKSLPSVRIWPPRKRFDGREAQVFGDTYALYRFWAWMLEVAVRNVFKIASPIFAFTCSSRRQA